MYRSQILLLLVILCVLPSLSYGQDKAKKPLIVAVKEAPPFSFKDESGKWKGLSIELWEQIASENKFDYTYSEMDLAHLLDSSEAPLFDVGVGAISVTALREKNMDFSHPFFRSGFAMALRHEDSVSYWSSLVGVVFSERFFKAVLSLVLVLFFAGFLMWLFERKKNREEFGDSAIKGLGASFWWSAVTMTTVGYGDKSPRTFGGRFVALIWMFTSVIMISTFTASIATSLTINKLEGDINSIKDLQGHKVGTLKNVSAEEYMTENGVAVSSYDNINQALEAVVNGECDAFIHDAPLIRHTVLKKFSSEINVVEQNLMPQSYALVMPEKSPLLEKINRSLLSIIHSPEWQQKRIRFLGYQEGQ